MKLDKKDKDNTKLTVKTGKKIIIALMFVTILLFISVVVVGIYNSEKRSKAEININNSTTTADNETESKTEDKKENEEVTNIEGEKTITEDEKRYYEQAKPYIDTILNDFNVLNELAKQQNRDESWKAEMSELAQKFNKDGLALENLSNNESARPLSKLTEVFGTETKFVGKYLSDWLSDSNQINYENLKLNINDANCALHELSFYCINGITLQEQLEKDIKTQILHFMVDSVEIISGSNTCTISIKQEVTQDSELAKNMAYIKIYNSLKMMSSKSYYDYLSVTIIIRDTIQVNKFMEIQFNPETRKNVDFNNISWNQIPDIADYYINKL